MFFKKKKDNINPTKNAGSEEKVLWPNLTNYRKAILLHNASMEDIEGLLKEYEGIYDCKNKESVEFTMRYVPYDSAWVYLEMPNFKQGTTDMNFWCYQNLLLWLSQKSDKEFCLAIPENKNQSMLYSKMDRTNPFGDSCDGIYMERNFHFEVPMRSFDWGAPLNTPFMVGQYLNSTFQFDPRWIDGIKEREARKIQIFLAITEE